MRNIQMTLLSVLFVLASNLARGDEKAIPIQPDRDMQTKIDRLLRASIAPGTTDAERGVIEGEFLRFTTGPTRVQFVRQLLYYSLTAATPELRNEVSWLVAYPHLAPETVVDAVLPYMETENDDLRLRIRILLQYCAEKCNPAQCHTFTHYSPTLHRDRANPSPGLVRYMFQRDPSEALRQFTEVYSLPSLQSHVTAREHLRWADHIVNDAVKNANFLTAFSHTAEGPRDAVITLERLTREEAKFQLEKLSKSDDWWVRLYVAEILRQHPAFRTPELVARLAADKHPLVREAMGFAPDKPKASSKPPAAKPGKPTGKR